jgi:hypothetical protein
MAKNKKKQQGGSVESYMGGLTDKGFNYNGAWGGTMQFGGNLPGAVGNMYARHGAPSKGKYAKKTMASAEEGIEVLPDPSDPERKYKLSSVVSSAKEVLNPILRQKDVKSYDEWEKNRITALRQGVGAHKEYLEKNPLKQYLSPKEVKDALGKEREGLYEDYIGALRGLREYDAIQPLQRASLAGDIEGEQEVENLNYGWRFATQPVNISKVVHNYPDESFTYSYDRKTGEYKKSPYYRDGGKMMSYYQAGLDFQPKTISKKGSKIKKDNNGYWNPDNWGEPVEIDSNEITMQGVYEPLLGISDTGDTQMMYPGEDYTFDGDSVTEYPVAQKGKTIPKEIYLRQAFKESGFDPKAISSAGALGLTQVTPITYKEYLKSTGSKPGDLTDPKHAVEVQKWVMNDLYNAGFINKPNQSEDVRMAKTLAAYNYGRGNLSKTLEKAKEKGIDIYKSLDWTKMLPAETSDYLNKVLLKKDKTFETDYSNALKTSPYINLYEHGGSINQADEYPLDDLVNFTNYNDMSKAKKGKNIKKAQAGLPVYTPTKPQFMQTVDFNKPATFQQYQPQGLPDSRMQNVVSPTAYDITGVDRYYANDLSSQVASQMAAPVDSQSSRGAAGSQAMNNIGKMSKAYENYQKIKQAIDEKKKAKQMLKLSELTEQASSIRPEQQRRKYLRPEDNLFSPDQSSFQTFGSGYEVMAKNGMQIGGNLTEIQNMYNPSTLYDNLGYEPLDESSRVKQFRKGGGIYKAAAGAIMQAMPMIMEKGDQTMSLLGDIPAAIISQKTKKWNEQAMQNLGQGAFQQGMQSIQEGPYSGFMKDGGYVSNDWQPQVIAKFGEYTMDQLLKPDPTMDTLRTGGSIRNNYMGQDEKMRMNMAMGGELQTHWGGGAEVMSYNPYSAGSGETIMLKGNSHEESDGQGNTGIGMSYGGNMVEAERGEPVAEMQEGGSMGDSSAVVFGNMKIPSYGASELNDEKAKGKKFKSYVADLSKKEAKQNKIIDKATKLVDNVDETDAYDMLKMNAGMAMLTGADMKLKDIAMKKQTAAGIQNAILQTAEEHGLDSDSLAKGKIKKAKGNGIAQFGVRLSDKNAPLDYSERWNTYRPVAQIDDSTPPVVDSMNPIIEPIVENLTVPQNLPFTPPSKESIKRDIRKARMDNLKENLPSGKDVYNEILPYIRPSNQMELQPEQLMGEMYALSTNVLEPVQAQTFKPMLETRAPKMSAQTMLNQNQADFNAMMRQMGNNPAALSVLAAQKQAADRQVIAQVEATNVQQEIAANNRNIAMLNDASLKNLAILDTQYQRQSQAKSATKAQAQAALSSIASKIGQNKLENLQSAVMQNMYNFRFGPKGRIMNVNPLLDIDIPNIANMSEEQIAAIEKQTGKKVNRGKKKESRNGSIVKAIKNL